MPTVVSLARQISCGASAVAEMVAQRLGAMLIDRQLLTLTAASLGRDEREVADREERLSTRWERLLTAFSGFSAGPPEVGYAPEPVPSLTDDELFAMQSAVMHDLARQHDCVVVGRAAAWVLRDVPGHIPVFLHAPLDWRVTRLCASGRAANGREARTVLLRSDRCRAELMQKIAGRDWAAATHYALALDVSRVGTEGAADLVVALVHRLTAGHGPGGGI